jgi:hypothetical protein
MLDVGNAAKLKLIKQTIEAHKGIQHKNIFDELEKAGILVRRRKDYTEDQAWTLHRRLLDYFTEPSDNIKKTIVRTEKERLRKSGIRVDFQKYSKNQVQNILQIVTSNQQVTEERRGVCISSLVMYGVKIEGADICLLETLLKGMDDMGATMDDDFSTRCPEREPSETQADKEPSEEQVNKEPSEEQAEKEPLEKDLL